MTGNRERIVAAATDLSVENPTTRPSVRAVAERAGVGASTLRYYFPTQRALFDAVLKNSLQQQLPDAQIRDTAVAAGDRLTECLTSLLSPIGAGEQAREFWMQLFTFANTTSGRQATSAFTNLARGTSDRVESWLEVLEEEGATSPGDRDRHVRLLLTVVDGLAIARAFPTDDTTRESERRILQDAVSAVLTGQP